MIATPNSSPLPSQTVLVIALLGLNDLTPAEAVNILGISDESLQSLLDDETICREAQIEAERLMNGTDLSTHRARRVLSKSIKVISDRIHRFAEDMSTAELIKALELCERLTGLIQARTARKRAPEALLEH
jgi:hypothetical protein